MTNPQLITTPFAENGTKNIIPEGGAAEPQLATMQSGFPEITQRPISDGGIPPERADFNGILNLYGQHLFHLNKGLPYEFDQDFADKIGGYPLNARIMLSNGDVVQNTQEGNTNNPNISMGGWKSSAVSKDATVPTYKTTSDGVNPVTGVADGAYFNVRSTEDADTVVIEYQNIGGVPTPSGKSYPSSSALNNLKHNNLKDRDAAGAHPASAILDGDKNQHEINAGTVSKVSSIAELIELTQPNDGQVVRAISFNEPLMGVATFYGGGFFKYQSEPADSDNVLTFKSNVATGCWVRVLDTDYLTPEMGGAQGVGDDRLSISNVMRVASTLKMKIKGVTGRTYTIASYDLVTTINVFFMSYNYLDFDLNGCTIKVADDIGDYLYIFYTANNHDCAAIYNGTIDQNTMNNPPITNISSQSNARVILGNYTTVGKLFKVHDITVNDALGNWQFLCKVFDKCLYHDNTINYSAVNCTHTDRTSVYIIAKETHVYRNKFIGDVFGNATTAVELHSSNSHMYNNLVHGFRSALFIVGDNEDEFTQKMENIFVYDNIFTNVQDGILIWTESGIADKDYDNINIERNKILLNTRRLTSETILVRATGIGTLRYGWVSQKINNLTICKNQITLVKNPENVSSTSESLISLYSEAIDPNFNTSDWDISENIFDNPIDSAILIGTSNYGTKQFHLNDRAKISGNTFKNMGTTHAIKFNNINLIRESIIKDNNYGETAIPFAAFTTLPHDGNLDEGLTISEITYPMFNLKTCLPAGAELFANARDITIPELNLIKARQGSTVRIGVATYTQTALDWDNPVWVSS